ncbi:MAG: alpha-L-fucosidase [Pseudobutyrivibrio sp.]|nr:alpha-L-fucosidase [Pseudobutyrivibrio sp.]
MYEQELKDIDEVIAEGPFSDTWESLQNYKTPDWFKSAKFGIFIHWGIFTVPEWGSEWYPRFMYMQSEDYFKHHVDTYGPHKDFGYKDFIPQFQAKAFDAHEWIALFKKAGAKYVVPVAEHHDGFQMYESKYSKWNAKNMGPKKDILKVIKEECQKQNMTMGTSSHRMEHWFFFGHGREFDSDVQGNCSREDLYWPAMELPNDNYFDPASENGPSEEFLQDWLVRICEIIDNYRPRVLYFDWWIQHINARPYVKKMAAYYYNRAHEWGQEVALVYKYDTFPFGAGIYDIERGQMNAAAPYYWQTDTSTALNSWCYTINNEFRSAESLVQTLVDVVAKNGNLLLNVGPRADGIICKEEVDILEKFGKWLEVNGEAIYDSHPWRTFGEGPTQIKEGGFSEDASSGFTPQDVRYTVRGRYLYATVLAPSEDGKYILKELAHDYEKSEGNSKFHGVIKNIEALGFSADKEVKWHANDNGLFINTESANNSNTTFPVVFKIDLE